MVYPYLISIDTLPRILFVVLFSLLSGICEPRVRFEDRCELRMRIVVERFREIIHDSRARYGVFALLRSDFKKKVQRSCAEDFKLILLVQGATNFTNLSILI